MFDLMWDDGPVANDEGKMEDTVVPYTSSTNSMLGMLYQQFFKTKL